MCLSAEVSFIAAAGLIPAGMLSMRQAWRGDRRYLPLATLPLLFGIQQLAEGVVWVAGSSQNTELIASASLLYMFFSWLAWPVWIPVSTFALEPARRKPYFLVFVIAGAMLGALQYIPYFAHDGWLNTRFLSHVIVYEGTELLDFVGRREITYAIYVSVVILPLLLSSVRGVRIFGFLAFGVLITTYTFFAYAYVSVFCFGGAVMSSYLVWMMYRGDGSKHVTRPQTIPA
ncbi:MAG: hypothetical protein KJ884_22445 [Gammaproteobacteria bacterium]|jgi:hypothetical protein|uniref:DUF6629 family protein n=1 Tax=Hyphomonas oceanitis TaxID=81033 RepID=UPI00300289BB|nr:hypothetical protein [Alphaproteobacteria bacterium]MBU2325722.1 hypothetical protein [Gammaproteobacteria bacterium]|tara:strand:+ start:27031 stop:27720 length:690 start_codon:yes stop_codon:yes gene_type:complete